MIKLLFYLSEVSLLLTVMYLFYLAFLRKESFFNISRYFLLLTLTASIAFPFISVESFTIGSYLDDPITQINEIRTSYQTSVGTWSEVQKSDKSAVLKFLKTSGLSIIASIYLIGVVFMMYKFFRSLILIQRLRISSVMEKVEGMPVYWAPHSITPFSFLDAVYAPVSLRGDEEFDKILNHERTHIDQRHTVDLLIVQFLAAFLWFNPVVWWLLRSLKETHEYIVDKLMINRGYSLVEYQTLLLRQLISDNSFGLVHNFNLSFIKKRITMMNNQKSSWVGKAKVVLLLVSTLSFTLLIARCNDQFDPTKGPESENAINDSTDPLIKLYTTTGEIDFKEGISHKTEMIFIRAIPSSDAKLRYRIHEAEMTLVRGGMGLGTVRTNEKIDLTKLGGEVKAGDQLVLEIKSYQQMNELKQVETIEFVRFINIPIK